LINLVEELHINFKPITNIKMKIKLFEKKYKKTQDHDGTQEIEVYSLKYSWLFNETTGKAFKTKTTYLKDEAGKTIGEETIKTIDIKPIKKEFPNCVKIKINDLYINI